MFLNLFISLIISLKLVNALEFIQTQDKQRIVKYAEARKEHDALPYTRTINTHLTDHSKIDYQQIATNQDKEIIFKAIIGGVIIHKDHSFSRLTTVSDTRYKSHCDALDIVNQSSQILWKRVLSQDYIYSFDQVDADLKRISSARGFDYQSLLTAHFIKWFYQALESYQNELNLFGGTATVQWLQESAENYEKQNTAIHDLKTTHQDGGLNITHEYIHDGKKAFISVLKPKSDSTRYKGETDDWKISILAKSSGLIDSINPAIPIRLEGKKLILDCNNFTHILEPFVGVTGSKTGDKFETGNTDMDTLLQHTLLSLTSEDKERSKLKLPSVGIFSSFIFTLHTFVKYFENTTVLADQRFKDLQTFNRSIDSENLLKLMVFWQLFKLQDMHNGNILFSLNNQKKFTLTLIDYNLCFRKIYRIPPLFILLQAREDFSLQAKQKIRFISRPRLQSVFNQWLSSQISFSQLIENLDEVTNAVKLSKNTRQFMHEYYLKTETKSSYVQKKISELFNEISSDLTVYDPIEIRPLDKPTPSAKSIGCAEFPSLNGYKPISVKGIYREISYYPKYQARRKYDFIFSVKNSRELSEIKYFQYQISSHEDLWGFCNSQRNELFYNPLQRRQWFPSLD